MNLLELQRRMAQDVMRPLTRRLCDAGYGRAGIAHGRDRSQLYKT